MTGAGSTGTLEEPQVQAMFDRIAGFYDRMNTVMTAGLHHAWRRRAAELARLSPGDRALDVATGTGDLAVELARRVSPGGEVVGTDFSERMLELARAKAPGLRFETANALALPYADGEFDAATVGFGARNFSDLEQGLREMARVVRPGGASSCSRSRRRAVRRSRPSSSCGSTAPCRRSVASPATRRPTATCPARCAGFPARGELAAIMYGCGMTEIRYILTAGGIIALHAGTVRT